MSVEAEQGEGGDLIFEHEPDYYDAGGETHLYYAEVFVIAIERRLLYLGVHEEITLVSLFVSCLSLLRKHISRRCRR